MKPVPVGHHHNTGFGEVGGNGEVTITRWRNFFFGGGGEAMKSVPAYKIKHCNIISGNTCIQERIFIIEEVVDIICE